MLTTSHEQHNHSGKNNPPHPHETCPYSLGLTVNSHLNCPYPHRRLRMVWTFGPGRGVVLIDPTFHPNILPQIAKALHTTSKYYELTINTSCKSSANNHT